MYVDMLFYEGTSLFLKRFMKLLPISSILYGHRGPKKVVQVGMLKDVKIFS